MPVTNCLIDMCKLTDVQARNNLQIRPEIIYKYTYDAPFKSITNNMYDFGRPFFGPKQVLLIQMMGGWVSA